MKKIFTLFLLSGVLFISQSTSARILRVGWSGPQVSGVDFGDVNGAITAASAGDTIQLYQNASVSSAYVNKQLVFLGYGYNLDVNPNLQAVPTVTNTVTLYFISGSANSKVQGVLFSGYIGADNITLSRCKGDVTLGYNPQIGPVAISNPSVVSSYLSISAQYGAVSNALISNNIITSFYGSASFNGLIANNVFTYVLNEAGSSNVTNNIFAYGACPSGGNAVYTNNVVSAQANSCPLTGSNNKFGIDPSTVFVNWNSGTFGSEANLALSASSPAKNAGVDGSNNPTDDGIYGGNNAFIYKLSGIPAIPAVYKLTAPSTSASTNPYTITVSVRSNN